MVSFKDKRYIVLPTNKPDSDLNVSGEIICVGQQYKDGWREGAMPDTIEITIKPDSVWYTPIVRHGDHGPDE